MAIEITTLLSWAFLFFVTIFSLIFYKQKRDTTKNLPPGEMGLPWIGETLGFFKAQKKSRLFEDFIHPRVTKHGKVFKTRLIGSPTIIVNGVEANKFFLSNEFKLVVSAWPTASVILMGKNSIMESQGEKHRSIRGIISTCLSSTGLEALIPKMCNAVKFHLEQHWSCSQEESVISLYRSAKVFTFTTVFECLLGLKVKDGMLSTFERVLEGVFAPPFAFPVSKFSRAKKARGEIERMLVKIVREKREEFMVSGVDRDLGEGLLLSKLVAGMIRGELSEIEVVDNLTLLVFAAHDTTSFAIVMTFRMLAQHPDCHSLLLQEHNEILKKGSSENLTTEDLKKMEYTWNVVRESMRLFPPIFGSFRKAITNIEYGGFTIPKGWKVLWTTYGTHLSEEYFKDPLTFNPRRFEEPIPPYVYLPFGGGPRVCAGYQLAKLNIHVFIHYIVTRYNWSLVHPDEQIIVDPLPFPSLGMPIKISRKL